MTQVCKKRADFGSLIPKIVADAMVFCLDNYSCNIMLIDKIAQYFTDILFCYEFRLNFTDGKQKAATNLVTA
ncbi:MAG: hypothetical protein IJ199_06905 [Prevotella sp.]|nr:hypothetical protein [Prevotella sp.]